MCKFLRQFAVFFFIAILIAIFFKPDPEEGKTNEVKTEKVSNPQEKNDGPFVMISKVINGQKYYGAKDAVLGDTVLDPKYRRICNSKDGNLILGINQRFTGHVEVYDIATHSWVGEFRTFTQNQGQGDYYIGTFLQEKKYLYYFPKTQRKLIVNPDNMWKTLTHFVVKSGSLWYIMDNDGNIIKILKNPLAVITNIRGVCAYVYQQNEDVILENLSDEEKHSYTSKEWENYKSTKTRQEKCIDGCQVLLTI